MTSLMGPSSYINSTPFLSCHFIRHDLIEEVVHPLINAMEKKKNTIQNGKGVTNRNLYGKGLWSAEEDEKLLRHITKYGHGRWS